MFAIQATPWKVDSLVLYFPALQVVHLKRPYSKHADVADRPKEIQIWARKVVKYFCGEIKHMITHSITA